MKSDHYRPIGRPNRIKKIAGVYHHIRFKSQGYIYYPFERRIHIGFAEIQT